MAIKIDNFIFGDDLINRSLPEFKALLRKHKVRAKEATSIFNKMHGISEPKEIKEDGDDIRISTENIKDSE